MNCEEGGNNIPLSELNDGNQPCSGWKSVGDMPQGIEIVLSNALRAGDEALRIVDGVVPKLLVFG